MKKILLISNQEAFLDRNKSLLNRAGFVILTATSADEALQLYRKHPVDLIISMLDIPDMAGDELCSSIRNGAGDSTVPFILVCYDTDAAFMRATECGASGWLTKPVRPEQLLEKVGSFLKLPVRRDHRASYNTEVRGMREMVPFSGMTHNISVSGILCETETELEHDDVISDLFLALDSHDIVADGKVVRAEPRSDGMFNYGVQFTSIPLEAREKIEQFVTNPEPKAATRPQPGAASTQPELDQTTFLPLPLFPAKI